MANRPLTEKEKQAWVFAKNAHKGQFRKFTGEPYFEAHVLKVNGIVKQHTTDEALLIAAICHDVIEDCYKEDHEVGYHIIEEKFGKRVADLVMELTSDEEEMEEYDTKGDYLVVKMTHMTNDALIIKLSDRLQNISDAFTASEKFRNNYYKETMLIMKDLRENRRFNNTQLTLVNQIRGKLANIESMFNLDVVEGMKYIKPFKAF
jgi:(p)ppGpp synthase/HD superfamily hydrolase